MDTAWVQRFWDKVSFSQSDFPSDNDFLVCRISVHERDRTLHFVLMELVREGGRLTRPQEDVCGVDHSSKAVPNQKSFPRFLISDGYSHHAKLKHCLSRKTSVALMIAPDILFVVGP
jgi:hypothetical protein